MPLNGDFVRIVGVKFECTGHGGGNGGGHGGGHGRRRGESNVYSKGILEASVRGENGGEDEEILHRLHGGFMTLFVGALSSSVEAFRSVVAHV